MSRSYDWDPEKAEANLRKHGVSFEEVRVRTIGQGPKLGRLNPEAIARLDDALRFVLGL